MTFPLNKKLSSLCSRLYNLRSYCFVVEVTFQHIVERLPRTEVISCLCFIFKTIFTFEFRFHHFCHEIIKDGNKRNTYSRAETKRVLKEPWLLIDKYIAREEAFNIGC